jgi:outer membrane biosynthesis protein TonB
MLRPRLPLLFVTLAISLAAGCQHKPNDDAITTQIKAKMFSEPLLKSASVNVNSKDGIVTLTGVVPDLAARLAAQNIASKTEGVKQVIDSTTMASPAPAAAAEPASPLPPEPAPIPKKMKAKKKEVVDDPKAEPVPSTPASNETASAAAPPAAPSAPRPPAAPAPPATPPPPQPITVAVPEGTVVTIRTIDPIDSSTSSTGQYFGASLDAPVVINNQIVLPRGLNVKLRLVEASSAGKFKGRSELTVSLDSITYQGHTYSLKTSDVQQQGSSRGKRSAAVIGGGAALGALIGGLAGGGKGAAIGAGVGAGGGTAVQAATHGEQIRIPSETRLDFTLHDAIPVTYLPPKKSHLASTDQQAPSNPSESSQSTAGAEQNPPAQQQNP